MRSGASGFDRTNWFTRLSTQRRRSRVHCSPVEVGVEVPQTCTPQVLYLLSPPAYIPRHRGRDAQDRRWHPRVPVQAGVAERCQVIVVASGRGLSVLPNDDLPLSRLPPRRGKRCLDRSLPSCIAIRQSRNIGGSVCRRQPGTHCSKSLSHRRCDLRHGWPMATTTTPLTMGSLALLVLPLGRRWSRPTTRSTISLGTRASGRSQPHLSFFSFVRSFVLSSEKSR